MARTVRVVGVLAIVVIAACGGSGDAAPSTTIPPTTIPPPPTVATTTTLPPTTTTIALDCTSYGDAMQAIAQSFLYQTFDGAAAFERQQADQLADSLLVVSMAIGALADEIAGLGEPLPGYDGAVALMLQAVDMDEQGFAAASEAARAGDDVALDDAVAMVDEGFLRLMDANAALATAQDCQLEG